MIRTLVLFCVILQKSSAALFCYVYDDQRLNTQSRLWNEYWPPYLKNE